ncbi:MAG: aminopeptidase P family protein [Phycisphaerae bacterium]
MAESSRKSRAKCLAGRRRAALKAAGCEGATAALLVGRPVDVSYLSGFGGEDSMLLVGHGWSVLVTDGRYSEQAEAECPGVELYVRRQGLPAAVVEALRGRNVRRLVVQSDHMTLRLRDSLQKELGRRKLAPVADVTGELRAVKDDTEVRAIRRACRTAEEAFRIVTARGAAGLVGRSEREVAAELDYRMRLAGAEGSSFETIVAAGTHGSRPHHRPTDRQIRRHEAVLVDWGAMVDGYCSDLTRVVFTGRIPPKLAEVYEVVRRAQEAGVAAIRPGAACKTPDRAARDVIESAGYGRRFVHGLGHGLGREVHEAPALSPRSERRLRKGMVTTVEPGIYLPGVGGVRIEDDVLVTSGGRRKLSSLPTDLDAAVLH